MVLQLQTVSTSDLYFICQMVDTVARHPGIYIRNIEDIFGDQSSSNLARSYPKWTCFHIFVEAVISSVIWEDADKPDNRPGQFWVDHLLQSNEMVRSCGTNHHDGYGYLDALNHDDTIGILCEKVSKQVFHVLFSNRGTMSAFGHMVRGYVLETSPSFKPEKFNRSGHLFRTLIPSWARSAVFHRDKGKCVFCHTDLTKYFSQEQRINYDHIVPLAWGGMNCITNLQLTCSNCNQQKGARSAASSLDYETWYDY